MSSFPLTRRSNLKQFLSIPVYTIPIQGDAIKPAKSVVRNAEIAEFLVDQMGRHYFIEINPRIQVEHAITGTRLLVLLLKDFLTSI